MSKKQRMLEYAKERTDGFTTIEANRDLFDTHPHRSIKDLEKDGYIFERGEIKKPGTTTYYRYKLVGGPGIHKNRGYRQPDLFTTIARGDISFRHEA